MTSSITEVNMYNKHQFHRIVVLIVFLSQGIFAVEPHYTQGDPGHFCWGAGINTEIHRGALLGRMWINDFTGITAKVYADWDIQGGGALGEFLIKAPFKSGLRPYATVGVGYHIEQIDTVFNNNAFTELLAFKTLRYGAGVEYRFGGNQRHGVALEVAYFDGSEEYYYVDTSGLTPDSTKDNYEVHPLSIGLQYTFYYCDKPAKDEDNDGYNNLDDNCPYTAEDFDDFLDEDGCPDYDNDMDGIPDTLDLCVNVHEDLDGFEDEDGCPEFNNDGDALPDSLDRCPNEVEDVDNFEDEDGCPEIDNDRDGIDDVDDNCPLEAEDFDSFEDDDGCPDIDNDTDGILDIDDLCPNETETINGLRDDDGCADTIIEITKEPLILINVTFEPDSDSLHEESYRLLEDVVHSLKLWDDVTIEIQGHTDSQGSSAFNMSLSQRRANILKAYFVRQKISEERLKSVGYGETVPVADNETTEGRALNRRVELIQINDSE